MTNKERIAEARALFSEPHSVEYIATKAKTLIPELADALEEFMNENRWIPVEECKPKRPIYVQVTWKDVMGTKWVGEAFYVDGKFRTSFDMLTTHDITHWKSLSEPPTDEMKCKYCEFKEAIYEGDICGDCLEVIQDNELNLYGHIKFRPKPIQQEDKPNG